MYEQAELLAAWLYNDNSDPIKEDWNLTRPVCLLLLQITEQFGRQFAQLKRHRGLVDFPDLEQDDIRACLLYAARRANLERLVA